MPASIDLTMLAAELRKAPETLVDQEDREDISPYLLEVILPMLARGEPPMLRDIDFDQFELYDPPRLAGYIQECGHREYALTSINKNLCHLPPACVKTRAFL